MLIPPDAEYSNSSSESHNLNIDSMNESPVITLEQIGKIYDNGTLALDNINLAIAQTQFVSLVGPSGCGKSTLLRIMAGLANQSSGELHWGQTLPAGKLAFVFQESALMPWATVWDNVRLPLKLTNWPKSKTNHLIQTALKMVELDGVETFYPRQLSGGMKMRVSIARSLVTQPDVLLMDEPFGALDEMTRSKLNSDLLHLWEKNQWTIVFVTHNIYEAVYLSQRVIVMASQPGRIVADIPIDAPYPRTEDFRTSMEYIAYCRNVSTSLSAAYAPLDQTPPS